MTTATAVVMLLQLLKLLVMWAWPKLKGPLLDAATKVCGLSKNHQWRSESWCWNEKVKEAVQDKHAWFKVYNTLKKEGNPDSKIRGANIEAHLGPVRPRLAPCWPHEPCYQGRRQRLLTLTPSTWQSMLSAWQTLRQRERNSQQYLQMAMVFSESPNRWATEIKTSLVRIVWAHWLGKIKAWH